MIDLNLQIDNQARALLLYLADRPFEGVDVQSFALYNGRERWIGLEVSKAHKYNEPRLFIIFGECRNTDELCVQQWRGRGNLNPPTIQDIPEHSYYHERKSFPFMDVRGALEHIVHSVDLYKSGG